MKILIIGKNGQVGHALQDALAPLGEVVAVDRTRCDLADSKSVCHLVEQEQPAIIVNAAAYTAVDKAESDEGLAMAINGDSPTMLAKAANSVGALLVHYSTDYVFDGTKEGAYVETDAVAPQSSYGRSKLAGEQGVAHHAPKHLILRTSWVHSAHGGNFAKTILRVAQQREALNVVVDQVGAPTSAALIARVTAQLIAHYLATQQQATSGDDPFPYGCYHLTASGYTSWYDYAKLVVGLASQMGIPLKATGESIRPIPATDYPLPAVRPANSRLDTSKLQQTFGLSLPSWEDEVHQTIASLAQQYIMEVDLHEKA